MLNFFAILFYSLIILLNKITTEMADLSWDEHEENPEIFCPDCGSTHVIKNGSIHNVVIC